MKAFIKKIVIVIITLEARLVLKKYKPKIVAITGNVGKTSTKDAVSAVLSEKFSVRKSEKSFNTAEIGVPLTVLGLPNGWYSPGIWIKNCLSGLRQILFCIETYPEYLVLEVGADKPGDISRVTEWLCPDVVIMTRIGEVPVHVEFFSTPEKLALEKSYLPRALKPGGLAILNSDDERVLSMKNLVSKPSRVITYGFSKAANFLCSDYHISLDGIAFKIAYEGNELPIKLERIYGLPNVYTAAVAMAIGISLGINAIKIIEVIKKYERPPGRFKRIDGILDSVVFDDSYNASPAATEMALQTFFELKSTGRKIFVIGDMRELGRFSERAHDDIGELATKTVDILVTVGEKARGIGRSAILSGMDSNRVFSFSNSNAAARFLPIIILPGDAVLIKGSESIRMERVVMSIMKSPEKADELLVRQNKEWLDKK